jgi:hypothetical protein
MVALTKGGGGGGFGGRGTAAKRGGGGPGRLSGLITTFVLRYTSYIHSCYIL